MNRTPHWLTFVLVSCCLLYMNIWFWPFLTMIGLSWYAPLAKYRDRWFTYKPHKPTASGRFKYVVWFYETVTYYPNTFLWSTLGVFIFFWGLSMTAILLCAGSLFLFNAIYMFGGYIWTVNDVYGVPKWYHVALVLLFLVSLIVWLVI